MMAKLARILSQREAVIAVVIVVLSLGAGVISPTFFSGANLTNILTSNAGFAVLALGMAVVLVPAHIDVSIGAQLALTAVIVGNLTIAFDEQSILVNPLTMILVGVVIGAVVGAINGLLVGRLALPAIIVTLGMLSILRGLLFSATKGSWSSGVPHWMTDLQVTGLFGVPTVLLILLGVVVVIWLLIHRTVLGRDILAVGGNRDAARRFGVNVERVDLTVFMLMGGLAGVAGVLYLIQMGSAQPGAAGGIELEAIAAAILGGASVFGGRIRLAGTLLGVLLLSVIENVMILTRVPVYWQSLVSGLIVVIAITAAVLQDRARSAASSAGSSRAEVRR